MQAPAPRTPLPTDAVAWIAGDPAVDGSRTVWALGDPDTHLTDALAALGHDVRTGDSAALTHGAVDVVLGLHRPPTDLDEVARVLRPGGRLGFLVPARDTRIPWARKLDRALGVVAAEGTDAFEEAAGPVVAHGGFGVVEETTVRSWQQVDRASVLALAARLPEVAALEEDERARRLEAAGALYDDYGRGHEGMQLPWVTRCYRATVRTEWAGRAGARRGEDGSAPADSDEGATPSPDAPPVTDAGDVDGLLIDFR